MIPHAAPIRFPVVDGGFFVNPDNPMLRDGLLTPFGAVELAAQAAGHVTGMAGQSGMLVEVTGLNPLGTIGAGAVVSPKVTVLRRLGALVRVRVEVPGVVDLQLALRIR